MKYLPLLLAASLVANAAFVTLALRRSSATHENTPPLRHAFGAAPDIATAKAAKDASQTDIVAALKDDDVQSLRDLLRSAGLPDRTIRNIISSFIWNRYHARMKELQPKPDSDHWWKQNNDWYASTTREQRAEMRRLQRDATDEIKRLLGPDPEASSWGWQDNRLSFLSDDKRREVQEIEQDYQDLIQETQQEMQGFSLRSDAEKIRFLMEEKKRDLASVLTTEELADYELRMSRTAQQLRWRMSRFDATEEEYRVIFDAQKTFDDSQNLDAWGNPFDRGSDSWQKRQEGQKQVNEQIKASLGPERYANYIKSQNHEYQQLQSAVRRLSLPPDTADKVFDLRHAVSSESARIVDNPDLGVEQKKQELATLATRTRDQIRASLGEEAADVYLQAGASWLRNVEQGQAVTFSDDGNTTSTRGIPAPPKKAAAK